MTVLGRRSRGRVFLCGVALLGSGLIARSATAEPDSDSNVQAAVLYKAGVAASEENRADEARAFFLAAWRLKQHWQIAANLADAEAMTGRNRDAAQHLEFAIRTGGSELSPAERQGLEELLRKARATVGTLTVQVNVDGADVLVDGKVVGKAPLPGPIFVEPGARVIEARLEGSEPRSEAKQVGAGSTGKVTLALEPAPSSKGAGVASTSGYGSAAGGGYQGGPSRGVIIAGVAGTTLALGAGFAFLGAASSAETTPSWRALGYAGIWSLAGAGAIGLATGGYALWGSGSTEKTEAKRTITVNAYPGGVVVTGAF